MEIKEETGINVKIIKKIGKRIHPNTQEKTTYFLCEYLSVEVIVSNQSEVLDINYKNKKEFYASVKTDIYPPVFECINVNIK